MLKCAPEQLRRTTPDQEAAISMVPEELIARKRDKRGAQVFLDISAEEGAPDDGDERPSESSAAPDRKREGAGRTGCPGRRR